MCWSKRCCFFVELDLGCLLIGIFTLAISTGLLITSIVLLDIEATGLPFMHEETEHLLTALHLDVNQKSKNLILCMILLVAALKMVSSTALIFGVKKLRAGFVLVYFATGSFVTFFMGVCLLLLLLKHSWWISTAISVACLTNIYFLVVVNTFYDHLLAGKASATPDFTYEEFEDDTELLVETTP